MVFSETGVSRGQLPYIDVILKDGTYHHFTPRVLDVLLDAEPDGRQWGSIRSARAGARMVISIPGRNVVA